MANKIFWNQKKLGKLTKMVNDQMSIGEIAKYFCRSIQTIRLVAKKNNIEFTRKIQTSFTLDQLKLKKYLNKKEWASARKIKFDISFDDITWPTHCPILGIELDYLSLCGKDNAPTFDRIDNNKGYTKDNFQIISHKANRIKNNGTLEELEKIVNFLKDKNKKQ